MVRRVSGLDVSRWQGEINWPKVAAEGHRFVFIRASIGDTYVDPHFAQNWAGARGAGLLVSAYHVMRFDQDPQAQVDHFLAVLDGRVPDLPLVLDLERTDHASSDTITASIGVALERLESLVDRRPLIYTARWWWHRYVRSRVRWADYDLWIASYTREPYLPREWTQWQFWQYTAKGRVAGISGRTVDLNWFNGQESDLVAYAYGRSPEPERRRPLGRARVLVRKLNVRRGPGRQYEDLGDLHEGDVIDVLTLGGQDVWVEFEPGKWAAFALGGQTYMMWVERPEGQD